MQPQTPMLKTHQDYAAALKKANRIGYRDGFYDGYETAVQDVQDALSEKRLARRYIKECQEQEEANTDGTLF